MSPATLKPLADHFLTLGVNRFVIHTSVHQPFLDRKPGLTLGPFGLHFTRHNTWAEQSRAWLLYLARCSHLLQQGSFVADLAYFMGEGVPVTTYQGENTEPSPRPPAGYAYDYLNAEALLEHAAVEDGLLVLPGGTSYRVLVLPDHLNRMTPPVLRKIRDLVAAGMTLVGPRPEKSPSLVGYPACDEEVRFLANEIWGALDGRTVLERTFGKGRVYWGKPLEEVLRELESPPDFQYTRPRFDTTLEYIHRRLGDTEIYFIANQQDRSEAVEARFRVAGKAPELWHPDTGTIEPASYRLEEEAVTVPLELEPYGSVFVIFRRPAAAPSRTLPRPARETLATLQGPWEVTFPPNWGAPERATFRELVSWTDHPDPGIRYFSGTAAYHTELEVPADWFREGARLELDLGKVKELAEVFVNGRSVGIAWKRPFRVDVTPALQPGPNRLEIRVTNLWANRMIGDEQPDAEKKYTFSSFRPYRADSPLLESGLLGPVRIERVSRAE